MNEADDCMVELATHKAENSGHVSKTFVDYLSEKYGTKITAICMRDVKNEL